MSKLETKLRDALRPVEPSEGFSDRVLARLAEGAAPRPDEVQRDRRTGGAAYRPVYRWLSIALAASVVAAVLIGQRWQVQTEEEGLKARRQLIEALRVTSDKLDLAYQVVNSPSSSTTQDDPGA